MHADFGKKGARQHLQLSLNKNPRRGGSLSLVKHPQPDFMRSAVCKAHWSACAIPSIKRRPLMIPAIHATARILRGHHAMQGKAQVDQ
eukprot:1139322-Pelagomonas_calceolata.AAC.2